MKRTVKISPIVLSAAMVAVYGSLNLSRVQAAQLTFEQNQNFESTVQEFDSGYTPSFAEEGTTGNSETFEEVSNLACATPTEPSAEPATPVEDSLSSLGPNLIASNGTFDVAQLNPFNTEVSDMCDLGGELPIGGGGGTPLWPLGLLPLGLLGLLGGDGDGATPPVPEPIAAPFVLAALGIGGVGLRKYARSRKAKSED
jgi:hypothetical protein